MTQNKTKKYLVSATLIEHNYYESEIEAVSEDAAKAIFLEDPTYDSWTENRVKSVKIENIVEVKGGDV